MTEGEKKTNVEVMNTSEQVLLNNPATLFFRSDGLHPSGVRRASNSFCCCWKYNEWDWRLENGSAVKCKSVRERHPFFVLLRQMDVGSEPTATFPAQQSQDLQPDALLILSSGPHLSDALINGLRKLKGKQHVQVF